MELSDFDKDLLEVLTLQVPWSQVCDEFHEQYGSVRALARRLFELSDAGYVEIIAETDGLEVSAAALQEDAEKHDCYQDLETTHSGGRWQVVATDAGFAQVKERLGEQ